MHWYALITSAIDELRLELRAMRELRREPIDFGLKVRAHPGALLVTAQNKMRTSTLVERRISISGESLETTYIKTAPSVIKSNRKSVESFIARLGDRLSPVGKNPFWSGVDKEAVADLLRNFSVDSSNVSFQADELAAFIENTTESFMQKWDVLIPQGEGSKSSIAGIEFNLNNRNVEPYATSVLVSGRSARVASRGIEKAGLSSDLVKELEADYRTKHGKKNVPDWVYRRQRPRPLLLIHVIKPSNNEKPNEIPADELIALGLSFRSFDDSSVSKRIAYRINLVELRSRAEINDEDDEGDDDLD
jgi:hypothetical protein